MVIKKIPTVISVFIIGILCYSCAGSGAMTSNSAKEYNRDFNNMTKIVEKALRGSNININNISESEEGKMVLTISRGQYVNNDEIQQDQGKVRIIKLSEQKTRVEVDNPDYHFSVPDHQREDYRRIVFNRINSLLNE